MAATALLGFALVWTWVAVEPMAFMDPEYPAWRAKQIMLDRCDPASTVILGDSRAAAGVLPDRLGIPAVNLAIGGGEPIEALIQLRRVLSCGRAPRRVILSFDPGHFTRSDLFWERSVRYGLMTGRDLDELRAASDVTGDRSVYAAHSVPGLPDRVRDALYRVRFPSFFFASLVHGGGVLRWHANRRMLAATLVSRGHYYFGQAAGNDAVAIDGHLVDFRPLPVLDLYFDKLLALLDGNGIETLFLTMPTNEATADVVRPAVWTAFTAYLTAYARRYPHFHVASDMLPGWPNHYFGDQFCHLNPDGAERLTALLAQRLQEASPSTQNDAQKGWLSGTGVDASFSVRPSSKRGS